jgi:aminoglycoside 3-N-acetyltransferase
MELAEIHAALIDSGIRPGDTLMIHGDAIVAAQLSSIPRNLRLDAFFHEVISFLGPEGTLIVPSFTYSFTLSEVYSVQASKSKVGLFSEVFRAKFPNSRTKHPMFSVVAIGKNKDYFLSSTINDCFGDNTIFDQLFKLDAKLMTLGCDILRITFTHYVEQKFGVNYRYFKYFSGDIVDDINTLNGITSRYFVGDQNLKYSLNLKKLKENLLLNNFIHIIPFGRVAAYTVTAKNYFYVATDMLALDMYSLIEEGNNG